MNSNKNTVIDAFVLYADADTTAVTLKQLKDEPLVRTIYVLMRGEEACPYGGCEVIRIDDYRSSLTINKIVSALQAPYALVCTAMTSITFGYGAIRRMWSVASGVDSAVAYADRWVVKNGETVKCPTMDFYYGSVRDDFDFGSVALYKASTLREYINAFPQVNYQYSGWDDLNLFCPRNQ